MNFITLLLIYIILILVDGILDQNHSIEKFVAFNSDEDMVPDTTITTSLEKDFDRMNNFFQQIVAADKEVDVPTDLVDSAYNDREIQTAVEAIFDRMNDKWPDDVKIHYVTYKSVEKEVDGPKAVYNLNVNAYDTKRHMGFQLNLQILKLDNQFYLKSASIDNYPHYINPKGLDRADPQVYKILNKLNLMDPWLTSGIQNVIDADDRADFIEQRTRNKRLSQQFMCFNTTNVRASTRAECERSGGTWDRPVQNNLECPFYMANKNWTNKKGGVNMGGRCTMPANMQIIGYRHFSAKPEYRPFCYNCKKGLDGRPGTVGPCCEDQKDRAKYPNLKSPDYMFPGDQLDRKQARIELTQRGLNWHRLGDRWHEFEYKRGRRSIAPVSEEGFSNLV